MSWRNVFAAHITSGTSAATPLPSARAAAGVKEEAHTWAGWRDLGFEVIHGSKAAQCGADLYDVKAEVPDLASYDLIGIASGIAYSKFYKQINEYVTTEFPAGKRVFLLYTCGKLADFTGHIRGILRKKNCTVAGAYGCKGYDTYGPLKLIGGLNKTSPTAGEIQGAVSFFQSLL